MLVAGLVGSLFRKIGFSPAPIVLGMVLGELIEVSLRQTMIIFDNNFLIFFARPYSAVFLSLAILSVLWPFIRKSLKKR